MEQRKQSTIFRIALFALGMISNLETKFLLQNGRSQLTFPNLTQPELTQNGLKFFSLRTEARQELADPA
jgi:hypothetical protein